MRGYNEDRFVPRNSEDRTALHLDRQTISMEDYVNTREAELESVYWKHSFDHGMTKHQHELMM